MAHLDIKCSSMRPSNTLNELKEYHINIVLLWFEKHVPTHSNHKKVKIRSGFYSTYFTIFSSGPGISLLISMASTSPLSLSLEKPPAPVVSLLSICPSVNVTPCLLSLSHHSAPLRVQALEELSGIELFLVLIRSRNVERATS